MLDFPSLLILYLQLKMTVWKNKSPSVVNIDTKVFEVNDLSHKLMVHFRGPGRVSLGSHIHLNIFEKYPISLKRNRQISSN